MVYRNIPSPVQILDWRHMSASEQQLQLARWMKAQVEQGFDLEEPCQMAITLIQVAKDRYQMVRSFHHILTDAWCFSLLIMDFLTFYRGITENQPVQLSSPRPYEDYIAWLYQQDMAKAEAFWKQNLAGFSAPTSLAVDRTQSESGVEDGFLRLTPEQTETLQAGSKSVGITLNTLVQGAWGLLLSRYSGDNDIVFGVTVAGRPTDLDGAENTVGLFINTLPLRLNASAELSVDEYLQAILKQNLDMQEYEFAPLVEIQRWSDVPPGEVLFNSLFAYENAPVDPNMIDKLSILEVSDVSYRTHTHYPITVVVLPEETLGLQISYELSRAFSPGPEAFAHRKGDAPSWH